MRLLTHTILLFFLMGTGWAQGPTQSQGTSARGLVLDFAGRFQTAGYTVRDAYIEVAIDSEHPLVCELSLLAPLKYWLCAAATRPGSKLDIQIFSTQGVLLKTVSFAGGDTLAVGFEPPENGKYFAKIRLIEGDKTEICFLYLYK